MAMEVLGRRKNSCPNDGPRHRNLFGNRKKAKEKAAFRLPMGKPKVCTT